MESTTHSHILFLGLVALLSSCQAPEPGVPFQAPSPLFPGYDSYRTIAEVSLRLPPSETWEVRADGKSASRRFCPRFDELKFRVPERHLGETGKLQLTFINDRLEQTLFIPDNFDAYMSALERAGTRFDSEGNSTVPPATEIWKSRPVYGNFVGWRDKRFSEQVTQWIRQCS